MSERIRVVIDTSVWIDIYLRDAAHLGPEQPYTGIVEALLDDEFVPIYGRPTIDEALIMLTKSKKIAQRYALDPVLARDFIESILLEIGDFVEITGEQHVSSDPKDDMFVEAAILGKAEFLVRVDEDLREPYVDYVLHLHGIRGIFPDEFLEILEARRSASS